MRLFATTLLMLGLTTTALGTTLKVDSKRLVRIIDNITSSVVGNQARLIHQLGARSKQPIFILLNSPGGSVSAGSSVIDAIEAVQSKGVVVKCFSGSLAASMAFNIMAYCNERFALARTKLMFHPMSLSVQGAKVQHLHTILALMYAQERRLMAKLLVELGGTDARDFYAHYAAETLWDAAELDAKWPKFLTIVKDITGVRDVFSYKRTLNSPKFQRNPNNAPSFLPNTVRQRK